MLCIEKIHVSDEFLIIFTTIYIIERLISFI